MDATGVTELNEFLVLDAVRSAGELTRPELGERLGLSQASVSRIVKRLLADDVITEYAGKTEGPGRNRAILRFNARAGAVLAVDLGGTKCHGALADLAGDILDEDYRRTFEHPEAADTLLASIASLRTAADRAGLPVRAVAVGIPALLDPDTGLAVAGPNLGWDGFDLTGVLKSALAEPFTVDNDVNLAALGQAWRGEGRGASSFVTLSLGTGIGGAVVLDGRVVRGRHNAAGEIGYLLSAPGELRRGTGGPALESRAAGPAIAARARELAAQDPSGTVLDPAGATGADVFAAAAAGDPVAAAVLDETVEYVAMAIANITAVLDPQRVILDGSVGRALEPYVPRIAELVGRSTFAAPEVVVSRLGPNATVVGAIAGALALERRSTTPAALSFAPGIPSLEC
jgi:glucokinase